MNDRGLFQRFLALPDRTFFLFGPRGTGKSTWLKEHLPNAERIDLLRSSEFLSLSRDPSLLRKRVTALPAGSWIVLDEVQKLPMLLDEVHAILEDFPRKYRFALTGSSARKLKRGGANLLAGRAVNARMFPLTRMELGDAFHLDAALRFGTLPAVINAETDKDRQEFLDSYCENYLRQEIQEEAVVRRLDSFSRFLEVVAHTSGQVVSLSSIARDVGAARTTVAGYFDVLVDTLLGFWLPAWKPRVKVKEVEHPKFYLFDTGVQRALQGLSRDMPERADRGHLFESWLVHEVRAAIAYAGVGGQLYYWRTPSGTEVDLIWQRGRRAIAFEFKSHASWRAQDSKGLDTLLENGAVQRAYGVYAGERSLREGSISVLSTNDFCKRIVDAEFWTS